VKDVYIKLEKETDAGIIVSGAKVVATNSALTHYNMIGFGSAQVMGENPDFALMFVAPMDAEGVKLISRASTRWWQAQPDPRTTTRSPAASTRTTRSW
jgi:4-hydroxyphenylacetate 3-monooxygenase